MLKRVNSRGEISLGKELAGKKFQVEALKDGALMLRPMVEIPDSDAWLHSPEMKRKLAEAERWMAQNPPAETDMVTFNAMIEAEIRAKSRKVR